MEACAEIARLRRRWRRLVRVRRGEGLSCRLRLRLAQLDGRREWRGRGWGVAKRMSVGGLTRACHLLCIM
jgi:hypothetical protein